MTGNSARRDDRVCDICSVPLKTKPTWFQPLRGWQKMFGVVAAVLTLLNRGGRADSDSVAIVRQGRRATDRVVRLNEPIGPAGPMPILRLKRDLREELIRSATGCIFHD